MASAQAGTGTNAVHNNAQIYIRMAKLLETTDQYTINIDKLATFFNDARAYYTSGRGQIAHDRLKTVLGLDKSTPFNANQYLSHPWVRSYINLMQVVAKFAHKFEETHLREKVNRLTATATKPESSSEVIDVDAEETQNNDVLATTQPQKLMEASKPSSSHGNPAISTPESVSSAPAIQSTGSAKPASAVVSETSREVKQKRKKPKSKLNYSALLDLEKKAQLGAGMNEQQQQQAGQGPSVPPEAVVASQPPPPGALLVSVTEDENSPPSTSVQNSGSALEPVTVPTPVQSRAHSNAPVPVEQLPVLESGPPLPPTEVVVHETAIEMEVDIDESKRNDEDITMKDDENSGEPHADDADVNMGDCIQTGRHDISATDDHEMELDLPATETAMEDQTVDETQVGHDKEEGELSSTRAANSLEKDMSTPEEGELPHGATGDEPMELVPQVAKNESTSTKSAASSTHIESGSKEPPPHHHPEISAESQLGEGDTEIQEEQVGRQAASDDPMNGYLYRHSSSNEINRPSVSSSSGIDPRREASAPALGTRQSSVTIVTKDNVKIATPLVPTIISSSQDAEQQAKQSLSVNPPAVEPPRQTPSNEPARPTPSLPGSVRSTVTPKPASTKSGKSTTPMGEIIPKIPKLFIPAIDGFNNSMKVLAFHPVPPRGSVDFCLEIKEHQMKSFMSWNQRRDPESPKNNVHKSRCLSLACYTAKDVQRITNEASVVAVNGVGYQYFNKIRSTFPTNDKLQLHIITQNGKKHTIPLSLSVFPFLTRDGLIDLGNYIKEGANVIKLYRPHRSFSEEVVFVLHVHSPTRAQLLELEKDLESDVSWKNWLAGLTRPFDISSSPFAGLP
ncbi:hypothetical protein PM082_012762 [Marasmius tenuissimus]|nr:hypothetical protein PM082_012762 [Marasmius tenuissimus]